jgi:hypothetical protein
MAWVKKNQATGLGTTTASTSAFGVALTNGSIIIISVEVIGAGSVINIPTDTAGNTYLDCSGAVPFSGTAGNAIELFYALNTSTISNNVITVTGGVTQTEISAVEFTGGALSNPIDVFVSTPNGDSGVGGGQNCTTPTFTPNANGELIVGLAYQQTGTLAAGTGFAATANNHIEYLIQAVAAPIVCTWNMGTNSTGYAAIGIAFKLPSGPAIAGILSIGDEYILLGGDF